MPKNENQKVKLYYLAKIMQEKTDDNHYLSMSEILKELEKYGISAERKSIYRDFDALTEHMGIEIVKVPDGSYFYYHVGSKRFELPELKLLVDAVQSSKFITERKSANLIKKITEFASVYESQELKRQVHVQGRIKTMNESIFYNVDEIHKAIDKDSRIYFKYMQWGKDKKLNPKTDDAGNVKQYEASPWALTWDDENYYMIAFDHADSTIKHYRVDKMEKITIAEEKREGKEEFKTFDIAQYANKNFGMFRGTEEKVILTFPEELVGVFLDRFGKDIPVVEIEKGILKTTVNVFVSNQFFGWIFGLGPKVTILGPEEVREKYIKTVKETLNNY